MTLELTVDVRCQNQQQCSHDCKLTLGKPGNLDMSKPIYQLLDEWIHCGSEVKECWEDETLKVSATERGRRRPSKKKMKIEQSRSFISSPSSWALREPIVVPGDRMPNRWEDKVESHGQRGSVKACAAWRQRTFSASGSPAWLIREEPGALCVHLVSCTVGSGETRYSWGMHEMECQDNHHPGSVRKQCRPYTSCNYNGLRVRGRRLESTGLENCFCFKLIKNISESDPNSPLYLTKENMRLVTCITSERHLRREEDLVFLAPIPASKRSRLEGTYFRY